MSRRVVLVVVTAASVLAAVLGWGFGQRVRSPAEIAAETAAPDPSLLTVPVELRELSSRVVVRGTVQSSEATPIEVSAAALGAAVVTRLPVAEGDELAEGQVAVEITGRPMVVLQGRLPAYRTMGPSMEGPDVLQLEEALARLGYDPGIVDGVYSSETGAAVEALYQSLGYKAAGRTSDDQSRVDAARDQVRDLERSLAALSKISDDTLEVPESVRLQADLQVTQAERAVTDAKDDAQLAEATTILAETEAAATSAQGEQAEAQRRLSEAKDGTHPDTAQPPTDDELNALQDVLTMAETKLADATAARDAASRALQAATVAQERALADAEALLKIAEASRAETLAAYATGGSESEGASGELDAAILREDLTDARDDLAELLATTGISFPLEELTFVPTLPREVKTLAVDLGSSAQGTVMTVTGASIVIQAAISDAERQLLSEGIDALVETDELGLSASATITFLANNPGGGDLPDDRYAMQLTPTDDLPEEAFGQSLRVSVLISSSSGEVLAVPLAAVSADSNGRPRVELERSNGETELVTVTTGLAADGFVEVEPIGGQLTAGDRVVVGRNLLLPSPPGQGEP